MTEATTEKAREKLANAFSETGMVNLLVDKVVTRLGGSDQ
jgi:hypothetical protein